MENTLLELEEYLIRLTTQLKSLEKLTHVNNETLGDLITNIKEQIVLIDIQCDLLIELTS